MFCNLCDLDDELRKINIPVNLLKLKSKKITSHYGQYSTPGWNDLVSDKHVAARVAFIEWNLSGKHRNDPEYFTMQKSRMLYFWWYSFIHSVIYFIQLLCHIRLLA